MHLKGYMFGPAIHVYPARFIVISERYKGWVLKASTHRLRKQQLRKKKKKKKKVFPFPN